jgi:hypothetical protein
VLVHPTIADIRSTNRTPGPNGLAQVTTIMKAARGRHLVGLILLLSSLAFGASAAEQDSAIRLAPAGHLTLEKTTGRVDQVVPLSGNRFAVRDTDFQHEEKQFLEIYDAAGKRLGQIGGFGRGPGQFFRLKDIAQASDGMLWVADIVARVTRFDLAGKVRSTRLVLKPGFHITALALDEPRGVYYLLGCLPDHVYLDLGCTLVHQYSLKDGKYLKSFLKTDSEALQKHLLSLEDYLLDLDSSGRLFVVDVPIFKVFRVDPANGEVLSFPLKSRTVRSAPDLVPGDSIETMRRNYAAAYLIDRILVTGPWVVVSVRRPGAAGFLLHILSTDGKQVGADLPSPGQLVGKTARGSLYFASRKQGHFEITEYRLPSTAAPIPGARR